MDKQERELAGVAEAAAAHARRKGASQAAASVSLRRQFKVVIRDGTQEEIKSAVSRSLHLRLFVDGRYSTHSTSQLGRAQVERFVAQAVEMTRLLMPDKHRALPDPALYRGRSRADLELRDGAQATLTMKRRKARAMAVHDAARAAAGDALISAEGGVQDTATLHIMRTTNGFADAERRTSFWQWATVSVKDPSGRRPSDWAEQGARKLAGLSPAETVGREAARRAVAAVGAGPITSLEIPLLVENRAVGRLLGGLLAPLYGWAIDQRRSCFADRLGKPFASQLLSVDDDPLLPGGWGSRRYDGEGLTAKKRQLVRRGVLESFFVDTYYGRKLKRPPTSGGPSNLVFAPGKRDLEALLRAAGKAILVTGFLGGNSNSTTGDFSHGIEGFLVQGGRRVRPVASMNIAGNHKTFWKGLVEVGSDPYAHARHRTPSLLFAKAVVAGKR